LLQLIKSWLEILENVFDTNFTKVKYESQAALFPIKRIHGREL